MDFERAAPEGSHFFPGGVLPESADELYNFVEKAGKLTPDGLAVVTAHYDRAVAPTAPYMCYGVEDARVSRVCDRWLMTTCTVSPERHATTLYESANGLDWTCRGIVLDHQNKDMTIFEGLIDGRYWALTRPIGDHWFAWPPGSMRNVMRRARRSASSRCT